MQYPPLTAFFGWVALKLFGTSLVGFRFFAAVVQALALVLTGMMAKEIAQEIESRMWKTENSDGEIRNSKLEIRKEEKAQDPGSENELGAPASRHGDWAAVVAAGAGVPFCLGGGALMQYISFDYVCWVLVAYGMVRVLKNEAKNQRSREVTNAGAKWWVMVGAAIGLGMMAKWTMGFLVAGVVVGVFATEARRFLRSGWLWLGVVMAVAIWGPNLWWQWQRGFPSVEFLGFLHTRDVKEGLTDWFLVGQVELTLLAFPLAVAGLWFYFFAKKGRPYRAIGWMYVVPLLLLLVMRGRDYYLAPAYPMLYAAGAVWLEKQWRLTSGESREKTSAKVQGYKGAWIESKRQNSKIENRDSRDKQSSETVEKWNSKTVAGARWMRRSLPAILVVDAVVAGCVALPIMPVNSLWWRMAAQVDTVLPEELGWEELTQTVARIRDGLPDGDRARLGILTRNYGEMGALNLYGEKYGLPRAISGVNSSWERGYGNPAPETVITVGYARDFVEEHFASCTLVGHPGNQYGVATEETIEDPDTFLCTGLKESWDEFWKKVKLFA